MRKRGAIVIGGLVVISIAVWAVVQLGPEQVEPVATGATPTTGSAGLVAHIDPETGETVVTADAGAATSTSHEDLVEEPSPVPDGGIMVDLRGRFQNAAVATADSDSIVIECVPDSCKHGGGQ